MCGMAWPYRCLIAEHRFQPLVCALQLDLMTKIRDNKIYENRAHFQKHAAQPLNFSSFQIQEYLKASAFRWPLALFLKRASDMSAIRTLPLNGF